MLFFPSQSVYRPTTDTIPSRHWSMSRNASVPTHRQLFDSGPMARQFFVSSTLEATRSASTTQDLQQRMRDLISPLLLVNTQMKLFKCFRAISHRQRDYQQRACTERHREPQRAPRPSPGTSASSVSSPPAIRSALACDCFENSFGDRKRLNVVSLLGDGRRAE